MTENQAIKILKEEKSWESDNRKKDAFSMAIQSLEENQRYKAIIRDKVIDEAIHEAAKAICIGCGYLKEDKCTYKGSNCGVSKPMLETVTEALEQMKNNDLGE